MFRAQNGTRQRVLPSSRPRWRPRAAGSTALPMQLGLQAAHYLLGCRYWCTNMLSSLSIQPPLFLQRNGDSVALAVENRYYWHCMPGAVLRAPSTSDNPHLTRETDEAQRGDVTSYWHTINQWWSRKAGFSDCQALPASPRDYGQVPEPGGNSFFCLSYFRVSLSLWLRAADIPAHPESS